MWRASPRGSPGPPRLRRPRNGLSRNRLLPRYRLLLVLKCFFADELVSLPGYVRCSSKLRHILAPHIATVLNAGLSVLLDFPANTVEQRSWMRGILENTKASHQLHLLNAPDAPDEVCLAGLRERNSRSDHPFTVTEAQFHQISGHFVAPSADERFTVVRHDKGN